MSAPLVVNTRDGVCWTRRAVTSGGMALYAPESVKSCPEFVMATIDELAEQGIVGSADVLPMPVAPERPLLSVRTRELVEMEADRNRWKTEAGELRARVAELESSPLAWAEKLDAKSLDNFLIALSTATEYEPMDGAIAQIHELIRSYREDPCRPCGCPKRFDRHAWGCPTLPAEDDGTGFFQPGHAYTHRPGPDSPGGDRLRFYCESVTTDRTTGQPVARGWGGRRYGDRWTSVQRAHGLEDWQSGAWVDTTDGEREPAAPLTVFRASHDSIVMGLYTTAAEARAHCVAEERRTWAKHESPVFDWIEDEEDGVAELVALSEEGEPETVTGYVVTALEVAAAYDEEADE